MIRRYLTSVEADLDRAVLEANGLEARVRRDDAGGMLPALLFSMEAALMVPWEDAVRAIAILDEPEALSGGGS